MRTLRVVLFAWILTDCGAAAGWLIGKPFSRQAQFVGGTVVGTLTILLVIKLLVQYGWIDPERRRGASIGGLCGFTIAAPLAVMNLDQPLVAFGVMAFVGLAMMLGGGMKSAR